MFWNTLAEHTVKLLYLFAHNESASLMETGKGSDINISRQLINFNHLHKQDAINTDRSEPYETLMITCWRLSCAFQLNVAGQDDALPQSSPPRGNVGNKHWNYQAAFRKALSRCMWCCWEIKGRQMVLGCFVCQKSPGSSSLSHLLLSGYSCES